MTADPTSSELRLGGAVNLLRGLRPGWASAAEEGPFFLPPKEPFRTFPLTHESRGAGTWSGPVLSLHDSLADLLDELFGVRILPFPATVGRFHVPASALTLCEGNQRSTLASLSRRLGIDLSRAAGGFLLLSLRRRDAECEHEAERSGLVHRSRMEEYWTRGGRNALGRLRVAAKVSRSIGFDSLLTHHEARRYLEYFYDFGTHFVSQVELGGLLLQVFLCRTDRYRLLKDLVRRETGGHRLTGRMAVAMAHVTGPEWVEARGKIVDAARDPQFVASLAAGRWRNPAFGGDHLLAPFAGEAAECLCAGLRRTVPIAVELAPQSLMMPRFRAIAFQRLLSAALAQRFGATVEVPTDRFEPAGPIPFAAMLPAAAAPEVRWSEDGLDITECRSFGGEAADSLAIHCLALRVTPASPFHLAARRTTLCAFRTVAGTEDGLLPELTVEDDAFDDFSFFTREMQGAFRLRDRGGKRWRTIWGGISLAIGEDGDGRPRVVLGPDPRQIPRATLLELTASAASSLDVAECLLHGGGDRDRDEAFRAALGYLSWVEEDFQGEDTWRPLRLRALYLSRILACPASGPGRPGPWRLTERETAQIAGAADALRKQVTSMRLEIGARRARRLLDAGDAPPGDEDRRRQQELAAELHRTGERWEGLLSPIRAREAGAQAPPTATLRDLERRVGSAAADLERVVDGLLGCLPEEAEPTRALLTAVSDLLSDRPRVRGPERPPAGENVTSRLWRLVLRVRWATTATRAVEMLAEADDETGAYRAEPMLASLPGPAPLPSLRQWSQLSLLVLRCLDEAGAWEATDTGSRSRLDAVLAAFGEAAGEWLSARRLRAQNLLETDPRWWPPPAADSSDASCGLVAARRRLLRLLTEAWWRLGEVSGDGPTAAGGSLLDLAVLAGALATRLRVAGRVPG